MYRYSENRRAGVYSYKCEEYPWPAKVSYVGDDEPDC